jgi:hypothetical protein
MSRMPALSQKSRKSGSYIELSIYKCLLLPNVLLFFKLVCFSMILKKIYFSV